MSLSTEEILFNYYVEGGYTIVLLRMIALTVTRHAYQCAGLNVYCKVKTTRTSVT